ncbi:MAG: carboxymuconolactone decarboxylase family protein [Acidimicrobiia bacterium]
MTAHARGLRPRAAEGAVSDGLSPLVELLCQADAPLLTRACFETGDPGPIVAALAHVPELLELALPFLGQVFGPSAIDPGTKELVILRVSAVAGCRYCVDAHTVAALDAGLDRPLVAALAGPGPVEQDLDGRTAALAAWVEELARGRGDIPGAIGDRLRLHFSDHEIVELTVLAGTTLLLNRVCTALRLPSSPSVLDRLAREGLLADGDSPGVSTAPAETLSETSPVRTPARHQRPSATAGAQRHRQDNDAVGNAISAGRLGTRVWFYSNYHCNLACSYCLTDSSPRAPAWGLTDREMRRGAEQAAAAGFGALGVTGGEPLLAPGIIATVAAMADVLPTVVLSNASLFGASRLGQLHPWSERPVSVQVSLDSADPAVNDGARGAGNFAVVTEAIPRLVALGVGVRVATTATSLDDHDLARLCDLHRRLGVPDEDHVVRPVVRRGRGHLVADSVPVRDIDLPAELTITAAGAFWSPFGPTVRDGHLDTDLLVTRTTDPLGAAAEAMLRVIEGRHAGDDTTLNIR